MSKDPLRLTLKQIGETELFKNEKLPAGVGSINELEEKKFKKALMNCVFSGRKSIPPDLVKMPMDWYEGYVSSFALGDEKVQGLFLVHRNEEGELELKLLQSISRDFSKQLLSMLRDAFRCAINLYPESTIVVIPRNTPESEALAAKLFPGYK